MSAPIALAGAGDAEEVGRVLAMGFSDDPVFTWIFSEPGSLRKILAFFTFLAEEAFVPLGHSYLSEGACACWTPPSPEEWPEERATRFGAVMDAACTPLEVERIAVLVAATQAAHPTEPHWYLNTLATEPARRSQGLGGALLTHALARVDAEHRPAFLESTNPRNQSLYRRHGFEATGQIELEGGPPMTAMWRPAR